MKIEQIDTSTTAGKAEVMRLAAEGRKVANLTLTQPIDGWAPVAKPSWNWADVDYGIIVEPAGPAEMWVTFGHGGFVLATHAERPPALPQEATNANATTVRYVRADQ